MVMVRLNGNRRFIVVQWDSKKAFLSVFAFRRLLTSQIFCSVFVGKNSFVLSSNEFSEGEFVRVNLFPQPIFPFFLLTEDVGEPLFFVRARHIVFFVIMFRYCFI